MQIKVPCTVHIWEEGGQFVAHALPLDVASSGDSPATARTALEEAVRLFVATAQAEGTLTQLMEEAGYARQRGEWEAPDWVSVERGMTQISA